MHVTIRLRFSRQDYNVAGACSCLPPHPRPPLPPHTHPPASKQHQGTTKCTAQTTTYSTSPLRHIPTSPKHTPRHTPRHTPMHTPRHQSLPCSLTAPPAGQRGPLHERRGTAGPDPVLPNLASRAATSHTLHAAGSGSQEDEGIVMPTLLLSQTCKLGNPHCVED